MPAETLLAQWAHEDADDLMSQIKSLNNWDLPKARREYAAAAATIEYVIKLQSSIKYEEFPDLLELKKKWLEEEGAGDPEGTMEEAEKELGRVNAGMFTTLFCWKNVILICYFRDYGGGDETGGYCLGLEIEP